jgi:hypothetical protein
MLALFAALLLSQSGPQPDEAASLRNLIDTQLISVSGANGWGATFSRGERKFRLADDDWRTAFTLVPEAQALALSAREASEIGNRLFLIGTLIELGGLVGASGLLVASVLVGAVSMTAILAVAFACVGLVLVGAVVSLIAVPHLMRAQEQSYAAVSTYNHGLTKLGAVSVLSVPLGP